MGQESAGQSLKNKGRFIDCQNSKALCFTFRVEQSHTHTHTFRYREQQCYTVTEMHTFFSFGNWEGHKDKGAEINIIKDVRNTEEKSKSIW